MERNLSEKVIYYFLSLIYCTVLYAKQLEVCSIVELRCLKKTCHLLNLAINNVSKRIYDDISKKTCLLIFLKLRLLGSRLDSKEILDTYTVFKFLE